MTTEKFNLLSFNGKWKILHFSWVAFFITFFMWFCHASLMPYIKEAFGLSEEEAKALLFLNVALTIPARTVVGTFVDKYGPRLMFSVLLVISGIICLAFASAQTYSQLAAARFLLGFSGAGFVIGIRLITEWFPTKQAGTAQGIYGGWGNFGSAIANFTLPPLAIVFGYVMTDGWRGAVATAGVISIIYALVFYWNVRDTPKGSTYFTPKKLGPMEVTSKGDLFLYMLMTAPMFLAMGIIVWRLSPANVALLSQAVVYVLWVGLGLWFVWTAVNIFRINREVFTSSVPDIHRYKFKQVALLNLAYMVTFGTEIAVAQMIPLYFTSEKFNYTPGVAAMLAGCFMAMNLFARPGGGYLSDKIGRKKTLLLTIVGSGFGYAALALIAPEWAMWQVFAAVVFCSLFVQAGAGATFGVVPTIKRRLTGQIAGLTGAYGNVGGAAALLINSMFGEVVAFAVMAVSCFVVYILIQLLLDEPKGQIAETLPDGSIQLIDVG